MGMWLRSGGCSAQGISRYVRAMSPEMMFEQFSRGHASVSLAGNSILETKNIPVWVLLRLGDNSASQENMFHFGSP